MEALSKFDLAQYDRIEERLKAIRDLDAFLRADQAFSAEGPVVRFGWPDWPEESSIKFKTVVDDLHRRAPFLTPIAPDTEEWNSVIQGWRSDPESAKAIGDAFSAPDAFDGRVKWVFSRRDRRAKIAASCQVEGLRPISLDVTWQGCLAMPGDSLLAADRASLTAAVERVSQWAGQRINAIFEKLRVRLAALYGERFRGLYVFGSYARADAGGDLGENSDLDVAFVLSDFNNLYDERERFEEIVYGLSLEYGLVISVVPVREVDFREGQTNFTRVISSYAVPVR